MEMKNIIKRMNICRLRIVSPVQLGIYTERLQPREIKACRYNQKNGRIIIL